MTTPANSPQPVAQGSAAPTTAPLQWNYPFLGRGGKEITSPESLYAALGNMDDGFFPLGVNGFPHGGVHFGAQTANAIELATGVRCIADGDIVAYKLDFAYPHLNFTQDGKWAMYSTGFVLVRHRLTLPLLSNSTGEQAAEESHDIYSLYMHMASWATYLNDGKLDRPWWWEGIDVYRVGNKARQRAPLGGSPGASGAMVCTEPKTAKKGNYTRGQHIGFLPEGSEITIGEKRGKWGHITTITAGGMVSPTAGGIFGEEDNPVPWKHDDSSTPNEPVTPEGDWGWVYLPDLQPKKAPVPVGEVVRPRVPIRVKAGTLMGQLGEYHDYERATPLPPVPTRQLLHLEVFADDGFSAFLTRSRARAAQLPLEQRTTLVIHAGARLVLPAAPDGNLASLGQVDKLEAASGSPTVGRWMKVQPMRKPQGSTRFLPLGTAVWIKREDQNRTPLGFLQFWRQYPLQVQRITDPAVGFDTSHTRGALDMQSNASRAVDDSGTAWWLVQFGTADGQTASGWVREKGHPSTQWVSPWAWPGFNIVDATGIQLTDAFKRNLAITGSANWKEQKGFEPSTQAVNGSPLLLKLERTVSKLESGKHAGKVTARAMQAAMRTPWLAQELADVILRYESEWGNNMERWEAITPLMRNARENWQCELQRIKKLQWWNEVKSVPGFPASPVVNHIHPIALVGNFARKSSAKAISESGIYFIARQEMLAGVTNKLHWPGGASGVTLGAGYDMKARTAESIASDMKSIGLSDVTAQEISNAAGLSSQTARDFCIHNISIVNLSEDKQVELLRKIVLVYEKMVNRAIKIDLQQHQFDALVSYAYNPGGGWLGVTNLINQGEIGKAMEKIKSYSKSGGVIMPGLQSRRTDETTLYTQGRYEFHGAPLPPR